MVLFCLDFVLRTHCSLFAMIIDLISLSCSTVFPHYVVHLSSCVSAFSCPVTSMFTVVFLPLLDYSVEIIKDCAFVV